MLGIALGSFMEGFARGAEIGSKIHERRKELKIERGIDQATTEGKAQFDADVQSGKAEKGDWSTFYDQHVIPNIANTYREAGDPAKAAAWEEFADSSAARKGGKLFASGLQKLQMGDVEGSIADMTKAANTSGYGPDGKVSVAELYDEQAGTVTGYKLTFKTKDGQEHTKNVAKADLPNFFAATVNPQAAFETKQASDAAQAKADLEVQTHGRKKLIEKELGVGEGAVTENDYQKAIAAERKRIEEASLTNPEYREMSSADKEAEAKRTVDERLGRVSTAPTEPQVYVDPDTGEQVAAPAPAAPTQGAAPAAPAASPAQDAQEAPPAPQATPAPNGIVAPTSASAPTTDRQAWVAKAALLMKQGGDAHQIASALQQAGVPTQEWPNELRMAVQPGLGQ